MKNFDEFAAIISSGTIDREGITHIEELISENDRLLSEIKKIREFTKKKFAVETTSYYPSHYNNEIRSNSFLSKEELSLTIERDNHALKNKLIRLEKDIENLKNQIEIFNRLTKRQKRNFKFEI